MPNGKIFLRLPVVSLCLTAVALAACSPFTSSRNKTTSPQPSIAEIAANYTNYPKITPEPHFVNIELALLCRGASLAEVESARKQHGPHANASILIYMNAAAAAAFATDGTPYPVGSIIVKQKNMGGYTNPQGQRVHENDGVGGMVKRAPGYDPAHGDWEYFYFENPSKIESGRIASCVQCHAGAKPTDYVFGSWQRGYK